MPTKNGKTPAKPAAKAAVKTVAVAPSDDPHVALLTTEQEERLRSSGPGCLADWSKQAALEGSELQLTVFDCAMSGAGFVQDAFKSRSPIGPIIPEPPIDPPWLFASQLTSVLLQNLATVRTSPLEDAQQYPVGSIVVFNATGSPTLDTHDRFTVVEQGVDYIRIDADLSLETEPVTFGQIFLMEIGQPVRSKAALAAIPDATLRQIACAGAGSLPDYVKQALANGYTIGVSRADAACLGPGSLQDGLKAEVANEAKRPAS